MSQTTSATSPTGPLVVVTGANGLVGVRTTHALVERGARVRAVVRREGTAPSLPGVEELVGDFTDADVAARAVAGADAVVTTVHPMGSDRETQQAVGVEGTSALARAAAQAGVDRFVHVSTTAVYDRRPHVGDVVEDSDLVGDDAGDYAVTKRDTDAAIAAAEGTTRVLVRPPAILGSGETSVWNTLRPRGIAEDPDARRGDPGASFPWVHVDDLATALADLATGAVAGSTDPGTGPVAGGCTVVDLCGEPATQRDYLGTVTSALGLEPEWVEEPSWTGRVLTDRARAWGWTPRVDLTQAMAELEADLRG